MSPLTEVLQQFGSVTLEAFVDLVAQTIVDIGYEAWQTVWRYLSDEHGNEARDLAFAHAVDRGHIFAPTY